MDKINRNRNIALVEFRLTGHHAFYLAIFAKQFIDIGCDVDIFVSDALECREKMKNALPSLDLDVPNINIHETKAAKMTKRILGCRSYFRLLKVESDLANVERNRNYIFDLIFFPYLDDLVQHDPIFPYLLKTPFKRRFSGLLMEPRSQILEKPAFPLNQFISTWLETSGANYQEIGSLVEDVNEEVERILGKKVLHYPDLCSTETVETPEDPICIKIREQKKKRIVTSLLGSIYPYKSLDLFMDCIETADPQEHLFVIAGHIWKDKFPIHTLERLRKIVDNSRENVLVFDQWVPNESVFDTIILYSDVLFAHYRNFRKSSNILSKAALHQKPAIVSNKFLLGQRVEKYNLGFALPEKEIAPMYKTNFLNKWVSDKEKRDIFISIHSDRRLKIIFRELTSG